MIFLLSDKMLADELKNLLENTFYLHRNRIRYNGIGPRLHEHQDKIWPRDSVDHLDESRKVLFSLNGTNISTETKSKIRFVIQYIFEGLRKCNIDNVFNKSCPLGYNYFSGIRFEIKHALDAYTSYNQILEFIHSVIRSIDGINRRTVEEPVNFVKIIFGSHRNFGIFKRNLKWFVISNARVYKTCIDHFLFCGEKFMDLDQIEWMDGLESSIKYKVYIQVLFALIRFIFELLRRYFYITLSNPYFDKLFYFRYDLWQKLYHSATQTLISRNILGELRLSPAVMEDLTHFSISKLKYHLKRDDVRPICTGQRDSKTYHLDKKFEVILKHVLQNTPNYHRFTLVRLLEGLKDFKSRQDQVEKIYFVRADIKDCFPSIDQNLLRNIITNNLLTAAEGTRIVKLLKLTCTRLKDSRSFVKYCVDLDTFKAKYKHLSVDHAKSESFSLEDFDRIYLRPCIIDPVLRESKFSKIGYLLKQGLRQGSTFSPILSSIYIQTAFNEELTEFLNSPSCRVYRYVDDILFISTDIKESELFMHKMLHGFKAYNITMNLEKLACNFECRGLDSRLCCLTDYLIFYRQQICLKTLACRYHFNHEFIQLLYTFRIHPHLDDAGIIKSIKKCRWDFIHLDEALNGRDLVIENVFERAALLAHRAATMLIISFLYCSNQDEKLIMLLVKWTVVNVWRSIKRGVETNVILNGLSYQQIKLIVVAAYEATWTLKKLSHRARERDKLHKFRRRAMMRYLTYSPETPNQTDRPTVEQLMVFETRIVELIKKFATSKFAKEVLLPDKDARF